MYPAELFFSLRRFAHRALWKEKSFVWSPLIHLELYLQESLRHQIAVSVPPGVTIDRPDQVSIGEGTILEPGVYIQGPCVIGRQSVLRHGAYLRGPVILGDYCVIGHSAEIKHSILLDFSSAAHLVYVGNSIVGNRVNLGAGVKCANVRFDRKEVPLFFEGKKIRTGLFKLGSIIGDRSHVGCNAVLNPGTLLGKESICYPLVNAQGYFPVGSRIKGASPVTAESLALRALDAIGEA